MTTRILLESERGTTRAALLENGRLVQYFLDRRDQQRTVGNIYKGRIQNVLPGMEAAFVTVGLERNAYLYGIDSITVGQEVIVQVVKEPMGEKGARVTRELNLPGRYLVLTPGNEHISLSRRLTDEAERERLQAIAAAVCPPGAGLIVRTAAAGATEAELRADAAGLMALWQRIEASAAQAGTPSLLYRDDDLVLRLVRDYLTDAVAEVVVAGGTLYRDVLSLAETLTPRLANRIRLADGLPGRLLEEAGIPAQLEKALRRRVWLDSGGYLVFDQTEALTVIDVNSGKFTGRTDLAATALQLNLEAAAMIARQLRLREIGGIVLIDFIDMASPEDQAAVIEALEQASMGDRNRLQVVGFTRLGLLELTRRKTGPTLSELLERPCPRCNGRGRLPE